MAEHRGLTTRRVGIDKPGQVFHVSQTSLQLVAAVTLEGANLRLRLVHALHEPRVPGPGLSWLAWVRDDEDVARPDNTR